MRILIFLSAVILTVCIACGPKEVAVEYTLTNDQLANLMLDLQFTDAALGEVNGAQRDSLKDLLWIEMEKIYKLPIDDLEEEVRKLESDSDRLNLVMDRVQVLLDSIR